MDCFLEMFSLTCLPPEYVYTSGQNRTSSNNEFNVLYHFFVEYQPAGKMIHARFSGNSDLSGVDWMVFMLFFVKDYRKHGESIGMEAWDQGFCLSLPGVEKKRMNEVKCKVKTWSPFYTLPTISDLFDTHSRKGPYKKRKLMRNP